MSCCDKSTDKSNNNNIKVDNEQHKLEAKTKLEKGVKLILLGERSTGKTCITNRLVRNEFGVTVPTLGASFLTKTMLIDDTTVKLELWDTAGEERYRSLMPLYYREAVVAVIVYDITSMATFNLSKTWITELHKYSDSNIIIALVGNKSDLPNREVPKETAQQYIQDHIPSCIFYETSALTNENINELFITVCRVIIEKYIQKESQKS
ncbi:Rab GTPase [Tieghemostelium lacteum]|uniref:Rab GTPase n=1 Tax=Tieghemostelium lacteum TaxID=361077 RepID=A0A152A3Y8_TIELA|nr:Rab GTPase [Tieghemostelium lacteum]|eukprot:KYR00787.1 Rab GTPase [Tieghemostelium lacteum]